MSAISLQPSFTYALSSEDNDRGRSNAAPRLRPNIVRRDTDNILSYYQSEHAGRAYAASDAVDTPSIMREGSPYSESQSSSEYSSDSSLDRHVDAQAHGKRPELATDAETVYTHRRRSSVPSEGGADRRRLAIVELDSNLPASLSRKRSQCIKNSSIDNSGASMTSTILSRRGIHVDGLALVAPPDASPRTYTDLTPPSTAPLSIDRAPLTSHQTAHQRSMSEAVNVASKSRHQHKSSRDVGIVGMVSSISETLERGSFASAANSHPTYVGTEALKAPIFQTPAESRSPSLGRTPEASESSTVSVLSPSSSCMTTPDGEKREQGALTPAIGESKDISQPVVGPIVVGITANMMRKDPPRDSSSSPGMASPGDVFTTHQPPYAHRPSSRSGSPYLYYEPGIHSTAGPLPPPPQPTVDIDGRLISNTPAPPRPPRTYTPLPPSGTGLGSRRDIHALRDALQLPKSVSVALASITPSEKSRSRSDLHEGFMYPGAELDEREAGPSKPLTKSRSLHVREGAHPPSTEISSPVLPDTESNSSKASRNIMDDASALARAPSLTEDGSVSSNEVESDSLHRTRSAFDLRRGNSWVSLRQEQGEFKASPNGGTGHLPSVSVSRSSTPSPSESSPTPTPPPKSNKGSPAKGDERPPILPLASGSGSGSSSSNPLKGALSNWKRFSALPRTPSGASSIAKSKSPSPQHSRTPSPQVITSSHELLEIPRPRPRPRIKVAWPDAMQCRDVIVKQSSVERSRGYADKINELAMYDCGLTEWVQARKPHGNSRSAQTSAVRLTVTPATPSTRVFVEQPRHTSHGSNVSEMTFPIRPDAYSATDLSTRPIDVVPSNVPPPALPYPSLAQAQSSRNPLRTSTLITSPSRNLLPLPGSKGTAAGFFASLGRKTSVKKDRPALSAVSPTRMLSKRNPALSTTNRPHPVQVSTAPLVPGGPRAAPGRIQRSQTFSAAGSPPKAEPMPPPPSNPRPNRQSSMARRPSLFARARGQGQATGSSPSGTGQIVQAPVATTPEFEQQVDRLADLLPHADREVLAGYLRRAGQDILAIGQYLEDEKNGILRRD